MNIGCLAAKYESNGDVGSVSTGDNDAGGISYGRWQLATNTGSAAAFVNWLQERSDYGKSYGGMLAQFEPGSLEFSNLWTWIADTDSEGFAALQDEYVKPRYYDAACEVAQNRGVDTDSMPEALKCVLFSNAIQHGAYWAGVLLADSFSSDPVRWIRNVYDTKLTDMSWSDGAPSLRPGLFVRWESEKQDAIALLTEGTIG